MPKKYSGTTSLGRRNPGFLIVAAPKQQRKTARDNSGEAAKKSEKQQTRTKKIASIVKQSPQPRGH
jgi:hypothetical protein